MLFRSEAEIDYAIEVIFNAIDKLRAMSPLWEMAQSGIDINSIQWAQH